MFGRSWVWLLSGIQILSLSHSRVTLINSRFTQSFMLDIREGAYKSQEIPKRWRSSFTIDHFWQVTPSLLICFIYNHVWLITSEAIQQIIPMLCFFCYHRLNCCPIQPLPEIYLLTKIWAILPTTTAPKSNPWQSWWLNWHQPKSVFLWIAGSCHLEKI